MEHYPSIAASLSTSNEALYKHTLVEYRFCSRAKSIFLRNSLLRYAVTLGRCALEFFELDFEKEVEEIDCEITEDVCIAFPLYLCLLLLISQ